jgi:hypothetical protein
MFERNGVTPTPTVSSRFRREAKTGTHKPGGLA